MFQVWNPEAKNKSGFGRSVSIDPGVIAPDSALMIVPASSRVEDAERAMRDRLVEKGFSFARTRPIRRVLIEDRIFLRLPLFYAEEVTF
jgi:hypothetical protein